MGEEVFSAVSVRTKVEWKCSACGKENSKVQNLACAPDENSAHDAETGYDKLHLSCKCEACGHREPWAKIHARWIERVKRVFQTAAIVLGMCVAALLFEILSYDLESIIEMQMQDTTPIILAVVVALWGCFALWDRCRKNKLRKAVRMLPAAALPAFSKPENSLYKAPVDKTEAAAVPAGPRTQEKAPAQYTEEELKQLPAWKRVEIMKQRAGGSR